MNSKFDENKYRNSHDTDKGKLHDIPQVAFPFRHDCVTQRSLIATLLYFAWFVSCERRLSYVCT